jgi:hypothetical protein
VLAAADRKPEEIIRAADAGVAMGMFEVTSRAVPPLADPPAAVSIPLEFNRATLASCSLGGRPVALASRCTGTGFQLGDLEAAMLLELVEGGRDGLAGRVDGRLTASGRSLQQDGKPVTDEAARLRIVEQAGEAFLRSRVPQLVATSIVEPA